VPEIPSNLAAQLVSFIQAVRKMDIKKVPSISETIDWARVLLILHADSLSPDLVRDTLHIFIKYEEDIRVVEDQLHQLTANAARAF
ncbi:MAG TPA: hypothetical protein P5244_03915, partial [Syntrophales bacterium]|nr:hypothetical protein [Syntrophales bacterium]